jgi:hypothetical protein
VEGASSFGTSPTSPRARPLRSWELQSEPSRADVRGRCHRSELGPSHGGSKSSQRRSSRSTFRREVCRAAALEAELHAEFADRRLNLVNLRREFFFATPAEVRDVLKTKVGNLLEFTEAPDAIQYHQSQAAWPQD